MENTLSPAPTRLPNGISTDFKGEILGDYPLPDPFNTSCSSILGVATFETDFLSNILVTSGDWTVTGSSSTWAGGNGIGGLAVLTPGAAATASSAYKTTTCMQFIAGQKMWFMTNLQVSSVTAPTAYFGLQYGSATTDGLWFYMAAGGALSLVSVVNSTSTTILSTTQLNTTMASATSLDLAWYYNGLDLLVYVGGALIARVTAPTIGSTNTYTLTNKVLTPVFQITPTASQTVTVDYVLAALEIARF
jgi:hypothetical protein